MEQLQDNSVKVWRNLLSKHTNQGIVNRFIAKTQKRILHDTKTSDSKPCFVSKCE